ncbi:uncharacterized protein LOC130989871 [Salvia miltiorrhiza]|uniref:uncharacterized protein LOC130989871 n=1 Tax=Salvia miltiorrhiza TaxID=226208 RepID=UPI0025AD2DB6|nr:uncharacterized protein LOC130989871 [Salvia miltiorrhiza]
MPPNTQDILYYREPWTRVVEKIVLLQLKKAYKEDRWFPQNDYWNKICLDEVRDELSGRPFFLNYITQHQYNLKYVEWKVRHLQFKMLLENFTVWYDEDSNTVYAAQETWDLISRRYPDMMCYNPEGEENWAILKELYDEPDTTTSESSANDE